MTPENASWRACSSGFIHVLLIPISPITQLKCCQLAICRNTATPSALAQTLLAFTAPNTKLSKRTHVRQVDFASTFLDTPGEFISIWSEVTTLTWTEVQSAAPIFFTMGGILGLAMLFSGLGWRLDQKVTS